MKPKTIELFVPGRLCLFGEHSDWAGVNRHMNDVVVPGRAIVTGIEQGIYGRASISEGFSITSNLPEYGSSSYYCEMSVGKLRETAKEGGFFSYVAGVASYFCEWYHVGGIYLEITNMTLPMKSGLSSSAAICVMVADAFNQLYELHLNTLGLMNIAYWGEQRTPSRCGRLDQACAFGKIPVSMIFDGNELEVELIQVKKPLYYVFADLMAEKDTVKILADLNQAYPFPHSEKEKVLHEALGKDNWEITERAIRFLKKGEVEKLGELMKEAQKLFDEKVAPLCPEELSAPILHNILRDKRVEELTWGGKGVGSQGDGAVQFLAKGEQEQKCLLEYLSKEKRMTAYALILKPKYSVRKAVIPVAGFGTRLYPETRGVKKEFCPVVDRDGLVKPAILILLEELDSMGIEEICLVVNCQEEAFYREFFMHPLPMKHYEKLSEQMKQYEDRIHRIGRKLHFVVQEEQNGFGHAVYQSKTFAGGEPVLLLLGDMIYQSYVEESCIGQLLKTYECHGQPIVAIHRVSLENVIHCGIFTGSWEDKNETVLTITNVVEKPSCISAKDNLKVSSKIGKEGYYAAFGAYVINQDIYDRLGENIQQKIVNERGEIELTDALNYVKEKKGLLGFVPEGKSYDLGNPEAYRRTVSEFGKTDWMKRER